MQERSSLRLPRAGIRGRVLDTTREAVDQRRRALQRVDSPSPDHEAR